MAYGVANLDKPLTREGVYLADGIYASVGVGAGDAPKQMMFSLDFANAPIQTADFIRIVEGKTPAGGRRAWRVRRAGRTRWGAGSADRHDRRQGRARQRHGGL